MTARIVVLLALLNLAPCQSVEKSSSDPVFCQIIAAGDENSLLESAEGRLFEYLFGSIDGRRKYNPLIRPKKDANEAINVSVKYNLLSINSLDDRKQELSTTGYFKLEWVDEFLTWDPQDFENLTTFVVHPEEIWLPSDIGIENSVETIYEESFRKEFRAIIASNGKVLWTPGGRIYTVCQLDVTYYPFDFQSCPISMSSWAYSDKHVHLTTEIDDKIGLDDYHINGEWHLADTAVISGVRQYSQPYSFVVFKIDIQRKFYYHVINLLLPCSLLSGLIVIVFKLPAQSGEKAGLGITILLSFSVFLLMIAEMLPTTSESLPVIGFYLTFLLFASSTSLLITVYSMGMYHATGERMVPTKVRRILYSLAYITLTTRPTFSDLKEIPSFISSRFINRHKKKNTGAKAAGLAKYLNQPSQVMRQISMPSNDKYSGQYDIFDDALLAGHMTATLWQPEEKSEQDEIDGLVTLRKSLSTYIDEITWKVKVVEVREIVKDDWQQCALCIDRICFRIFSLVIGLATFLMCIAVPISQELSAKSHWID